MASGETTASFSSLLDQAILCPSGACGTLAGTSLGTSQSPAHGDDSATGATTKRESKSLDSKPRDSQGGGKASTETSASSRHASDETVPAAVVQPVLSRAFPWSAEIKDFTPDTLVTGAALGDEKASSPASGLNSTANTGKAGSPEAKSSDSKPSDSQGRGNALGQTSASSRHASDETVPAIAMQPLLSRAFPWSAGIKDFTPDALITGVALSDEAASSPASGANSTANTGKA